MQSSIVHKLLNTLDVIGAAQTPMSFSEIVQKTGLNKSTIHRLLAIGVEEKMIRFDSHKKVYHIGERLFDLVGKAYQGQDVQAVALEEMVRLYERFDVNVTVGVPSGLEVVYLRVLESSQPMGGVQRPGMRESVHSSASGKAIMAYLPDRIIDTLLKDHTFHKYTDRTRTTVEGFKEDLAFVRTHGYGKNDREEYENFLGIAAPIFNYMAEPIAVLNIWSVYPRHTIDDLTEWSSELVAAAQRVTKLLGGIRPDSTSFRTS